MIKIQISSGYTPETVFNQPLVIVGLLENLHPGGAQQHLAEVATAEIAEGLVRRGQLATRLSEPAIAPHVACYRVTGSISPAGGTIVRLQARLVDAASGRMLASSSVEGLQRDLFALVDALVGALLDMVRDSDDVA